MTRTEQRKVLEAYSKTLNKESHNLKDAPEILWQQIYNRLQWVDGGVGAGPLAMTLAPQLARRSSEHAKPWLRRVNRLSESEALVRTLTGHTNVVTSCAFFANGESIILTIPSAKRPFWKRWPG